MRHPGQVVAAAGLTSVGVAALIVGEVFRGVILLALVAGAAGLVVASRRQAERHFRQLAERDPISGPKIVVERRSTYADRLRPYKVVADGKTIGEVWDGETLELPLPEATRRVWLRIAWGRSRKLDVSQNTAARIVCGGRPAAFAIFFGTVGASRYVDAHVVSGGPVQDRS